MGIPTPDWPTYFEPQPEWDSVEERATYLSRKSWESRKPEDYMGQALIDDVCRKLIREEFRR